MMMAAAGCLTYEFQVTLPVMASRGLHAGSAGFGFMTAAMGLGAVLGGLLVAARGKTGVRPLVVAAAGFGIALTFATLAPSLALELVALVFVGWASISFMSTGNSTLQLTADPAMRGRVMSLWFVVLPGVDADRRSARRLADGVHRRARRTRARRRDLLLVALAGLVALGGLPRRRPGRHARRPRSASPAVLPESDPRPQRSLPRPMVGSTSRADTDRMITVENVTKRYGDKLAVDDLSFKVKPGIVTGFLGPNGAGKSTTMRLILGLDAPTAGTVTIDGRQYADLDAPLHEVGAMLEARAIHTGRSAYNHLLALAQTHGIGRAARQRGDRHRRHPGRRAQAGRRILAWHGPAARRRGGAARRPEGADPRRARQRPRPRGHPVDPRRCSSGLANEGRTVFLSSHLMAEMAQTAEHLVVIGRGRLIADTTRRRVRRSAPRPAPPSACARRRRPRCATRWRRRERAIDSVERGVLEVHGLSGQADRRDRPGRADRACRADPDAAVARGRVHAPHRRHRRVPRRRPTDDNDDLKAAA